MKIKIFCGHNHELKKYDTRHKNIDNGDGKGDRLHCNNCNEYQDKFANNVSKGVMYKCDICEYYVCMKCIIERFNLYFKLE
jgi:hypothetical protein